MRYWYFAGNKIAGPLDAAAISALPGFHEQMLVCPEGKDTSVADHWNLAGEIAELKSALKPAQQLSALMPPRAPGSVSTAAEVSVQEPQNPEQVLSRAEESLKLQQKALGDFKHQLINLILEFKTNLENKVVDLEKTQRILSEQVSRLMEMIQRMKKHAVQDFAAEDPLTRKAQEAAELIGCLSGTAPAPPPQATGASMAAEAAGLAPPTGAAAPAVRKVLVADDDEVMRYLYSLILAERHFTMVEAFTGRQALRMAETHCPDLIIMDHDMPEMKGYEVIQALKNHPTLKKIPIVFVTGKDFDPQFSQWVTQQVEAFVSKPFTAEVLAQAVQKALQKPLS